VEIDDAIDAVVSLLQLDEFLDGAEIVAEMKVAGRLDARKDAGGEFAQGTLGKSLSVGGGVMAEAG
jgi:hypothetical protein